MNDVYSIMKICHCLILLLYTSLNQFKSVDCDWSIRKIFTDGQLNQTLSDESKISRKPNHLIFNVKNACINNEEDQDCEKDEDEEDDYYYEGSLNNQNADKINYIIKPGKHVSGALVPFDNESFDIYLRPRKLHQNNKKRISNKSVQNVKQNKSQAIIDAKVGNKHFSFSSSTNGWCNKVSSNSCKSTTRNDSKPVKDCQKQLNTNQTNPYISNLLRCNGSIEGILLLSFNFSNNNNDGNYKQEMFTNLSGTRNIMKDLFSPEKLLGLPVFHEIDKKNTKKIKPHFHNNHLKSNHRSNLRALHNDYELFEADKNSHKPHKGFINYKRKNYLRKKFRKPEYETD